MLLLNYFTKNLPYKIDLWRIAWDTCEPSLPLNQRGTQPELWSVLGGTVFFFFFFFVTLCGTSTPLTCLNLPGSLPVFIIWIISARLSRLNQRFRALSGFFCNLLMTNFTELWPDMVWTNVELKISTVFFFPPLSSSHYLTAALSKAASFAL